MKAPLLPGGDQCGLQPSAPPASPSAPPLIELISDEELSQLLQMLKASVGTDEVQIRLLRIQLYNKVINQTHAKLILAEIQEDFRAQALREVYERQLLIDDPTQGPGLMQQLATEGAMGLKSSDASVLKEQIQQTASQALQFLPEGHQLQDGFDLSALPSAPPSSFLKPTPSAPPLAPPGSQYGVLLVHHDGKVVSLLGDAASLSLTDVFTTGAQHMGVLPFDSKRHYATMVWPGRRNLTDLTTPLFAQAVPTWSRVLWMEIPVLGVPQDKGTVADPKASGHHFQDVRSTFFAISQSGGGVPKVSKGELRNFFWNMNLSDGAFTQLWERIDTRSRGFLDIDDLLHLVGRAHTVHPQVPIDALLYEAASLILNAAKHQQPHVAIPIAGEMHFDRDIASTPHGIGCCGACEKHFCSYFWSLLCQISVPALLLTAAVEADLSGHAEQWLMAAAFVYIVYLVHAFCCSKFGTSLGNRMTGLDNICNAMEAPKSENPYFRWHVQCYHYETRTHTEHYTVNGNQQSRTVTRTHRVNTWSSTHTGIIPTVDATPTFVPDTDALMTQIDTELDLDFTHSNYLQCYHHWCMANRFDLHQDHTRTEDLPSRKAAILAEWVSGVRPCWLRRSMYAIASIFLCSLCFRLVSQSRSGYQKFTYRKRCYMVDYSPPARCHFGAAAALAACATGVAFSSQMR